MTGDRAVALGPQAVTPDNGAAPSAEVALADRSIIFL